MLTPSALLLGGALAEDGKGKVYVASPWWILEIDGRDVTAIDV